MFRYSKTKQAEPQFTGLSATGLSLNSEWYSQGKTIETLVGQWTADWSPTFSTELKVSSRDYDSVPTLNSNLPLIGLNITGPTPDGTPGQRADRSRFLNFGTDNSRQRERAGHQDQGRLPGRQLVAGRPRSQVRRRLQQERRLQRLPAKRLGQLHLLLQHRLELRLPRRRRAGLRQSDRIPGRAAALENFKTGRPTSYTCRFRWPATRWMKRFRSSA
jgi:hypothetical protein